MPGRVQLLKVTVEATITGRLLSAQVGTVALVVNVGSITWSNVPTATIASTVRAVMLLTKAALSMLRTGVAVPLPVPVPPVVPPPIPPPHPVLPPWPKQVRTGLPLPAARGSVPPPHAVKAIASSRPKRVLDVMRNIFIYNIRILPRDGRVKGRDVDKYTRKLIFVVGD